MELQEKALALSRREQRKAISLRLAELKLQKAEQRLKNLVVANAKDFSIRMSESKLAKARDEFDSTEKYFGAPIRAGVESVTDIAAGLLFVGGKLDG